MHVSTYTILLNQGNTRTIKCSTCCVFWVFSWQRYISLSVIKSVCYNICFFMIKPPHQEHKLRSLFEAAGSIVGTLLAASGDVAFNHYTKRFPCMRVTSVIVDLGFNTLPDTVDYIIICIMIRCTGYHLKYIINKMCVIYHSVNIEETTPCLNIINMISAIYYRSS